MNLAEKGAVIQPEDKKKKRQLRKEVKVPTATRPEAKQKWEEVIRRTEASGIGAMASAKC